jgi:hypothetical protein
VTTLNYSVKEDTTMVTMTNAQVVITPRCRDSRFYVVHPLDDIREEKCDAEALGAMTMTPAVKWSLFMLRGYLVLMGVLVLYHVLDMAGILHHVR